MTAVYVYQSMASQGEIAGRVISKGYQLEAKGKHVGDNHARLRKVPIISSVRMHAYANLKTVVVSLSTQCQTNSCH